MLKLHAHDDYTQQVLLADDYAKRGCFFEAEALYKVALESGRERYDPRFVGLQPCLRRYAGLLIGSTKQLTQAAHECEKGSVEAATAAMRSQERLNKAKELMAESDLCDQDLVSKPTGVGEGSAKKCFVATAVYGDSSAPQVLVLRRYRDRTLMPHPSGHLFVRVYYRLGPILADGVARHRRVRHVVGLLRAAMVRRIESGPRGHQQQPIDGANQASCPSRQTHHEQR